MNKEKAETLKQSTAEMIASYCDRLLKSGGGEKLSDAQIEASLDRVVALFQVREGGRS